jgi:hypothetical protein
MEYEGWKVANMQLWTRLSVLWDRELLWNLLIPQTRVISAPKLPVLPAPCSKRQRSSVGLARLHR